MKLRGQALIEYLIIFAIVIAGLITTAFLTKGKGYFERHFNQCRDNIVNG